MPEPTNTSLVALTVNGRTVRVPAGATLLHAAREAGAEIPTLCYHPNLTANAVCRLCVVEVVGARNLQPSCVVPVSQDMVVNTETDRVLVARRTILELLASTVDLSETPEVLAYIERYGARVERFAGGIRRDDRAEGRQPVLHPRVLEVRHVLALHPGLRGGRAAHFCAHLGRPRHRQPCGHRVRRRPPGHDLCLLRELRGRLPVGRVEGKA